jgi:hypothetical protein
MARNERGSAYCRGCGLRLFVGYVIDQIRVRGSEDIPTRSMIKPQRRFYSSALMPEYSLKLDQRQSCGRRTKPALTGFSWIYSTFSLYSCTVRKARSKNRGCQSSPSAPRPRLMALIKLYFTDLMASEMLAGCSGAQMECQ